MLSLIVFLPLAGALLVLLAGGRGDNHDREPLVRDARAGRLAASPSRRRCCCGGASTRRVAAYQFVERHAWIPAFGIQYYRRRRRHQPAADRPHRLPDAAGAALSWESVHKNVKAFSIFMLRARERDDRRVRLDRPVPVLRLLGRDADPDVLPDRDLGLRAPHLRRGQVHPLHDGRQRADAAGDPRPGLCCTATATGAYSFDLLELYNVQLPPQTAVLVLPRLRAGVRDQGAAVPVPHLAARRARRGADRRLGDPGRRAAEDGHLRAACGSRSRCSRRRRCYFAPYLGAARRHRHHLRRAGRDGAARHEEAGGVLERQPPRLRRARHLRDEQAGRAGRASTRCSTTASAPAGSS